MTRINCGIGDIVKIHLHRLGRTGGIAIGHLYLQIETRIAFKIQIFAIANCNLPSVGINSKCRRSITIRVGIVGNLPVFQFPFWIATSYLSHRRSRTAIFVYIKALTRINCGIGDIVESDLHRFRVANFGAIADLYLQIETRIAFKIQIVLVVNHNFPSIRVNAKRRGSIAIRVGIVFDGPILQTAIGGTATHRTNHSILRTVFIKVERLVRIDSRVAHIQQINRYRSWVAGLVAVTNLYL